MSGKISKWNDFSEIFSISFRDIPGTINADGVTIEGTFLNDDTCLIPLSWIVPRLVLD